MNLKQPNYDAVYQFALFFIRQKKAAQPELVLTAEHIKDAVNRAMAALPEESAGVDPEVVAQQIQSVMGVFLEDHRILTSKDTKHDDKWLSKKQADLPMQHWKRFEKFLKENSSLPDSAITSLDVVTDDILRFLGDPTREGSWNRRGLAVGEVQVGKTHNYIALSNKAVDAGFKFILILAGAHDDLRSQTQERVDEGLLGYDTSKEGSPAIGVGFIREFQTERLNSMTTSLPKGDFGKLKSGMNVGIGKGHPAMVMVIKKNSKVLERVYYWLKGIGEHMILDTPLLLIDDEADHFSLNTSKGTEHDPTAINGWIRRILNHFEKSCYVGYTATPFANIFIPQNVEQGRYGEDLFPKDFIVNLPVPSNYVGAVQVFGLEEDSSEEGVEGFPLIRSADDHERAIPQRHKKLIRITSLPPSLVSAIGSFVLSSAARNVRGQEQAHKSMLVHMTRYKEVQTQVATLVKEEIQRLKRSLEASSTDRQHTVNRLKLLWEADFADTTDKMLQTGFDSTLTPIAWKDVEEELYRTVAKIEVRTINGNSNDVLDYKRNKENGLSIVAIGGDKLSRGLTLEGLSVSYYLRAAGMYDTLLQMSRWFGYRPGYVDLCRLYTTETLASWYKHLALVNYELRQDFDQLYLSGAEPKDFGFKVRTHPDGLLNITAKSKLRTGQEVTVCFSEQLASTTCFHKGAGEIQHNFNAVSDWIAGLPAPAGEKYIWRSVQPTKIISLIQTMMFHHFSTQFPQRSIVDYISEMVRKGELLNWTVYLASNSRGKPDGKVGGYDVGYFNHSDGSPGQKYFKIKKGHLMSKEHESIDLTFDWDTDTMQKFRYEKALEESKENWRKKNEKRVRKTKEPTTPVGPPVRKNRKATDALLIIYPVNSTHKAEQNGGIKPYLGLAISFPKAVDPKEVSFHADPTYYKMLFGEEAFDED